MRVTLGKSTNRKLIAVIGETGLGLFLRRSEYTSMFIDTRGNASHVDESLEQLLVPDQGTVTRTPVYEGDEITITF